MQRVQLITHLADDRNVSDLRKLGWSAGDAECLERVNVPARSKRARRLHFSDYGKLVPRGFDDADSDLGNSILVLRLQPRRDDTLEITGQLTCGGYLTDQRECESAVRQHQCLTLQARIPPDHN